MASQGPNSPDTGASNAAIGTTAWTNPGNIVSSNNSRAVATGTGFTTTQSRYLVATDFDFTIPDGATIDGVVVTIERLRNNSEDGDVVDNVVRLWTGGAVTGDNKASATVWPTTEGTATYGSSSDVWGATLDSATINDVGFGVALSVTLDTGDDTNTASVDHVTMTVHYTEGGGGGGQPAAKRTGGVAFSASSPFRHCQGMRGW